MPVTRDHHQTCPKRNFWIRCPNSQVHRRFSNHHGLLKYQEAITPFLGQTVLLLFQSRRKRMQLLVVSPSQSPAPVQFFEMSPDQSLVQALISAEIQWISTGTSLILVAQMQTCVDAIISIHMIVPAETLPRHVADFCSIIRPNARHHSERLRGHTLIPTKCLSARKHLRTTCPNSNSLRSSKYKDFRKAVIPKFDAGKNDSFVHWYKLLVSTCLQWGVWCPPYESVQEDNFHQAP